MFSQTAEYALRAMVVLANADGEPRTTHQIATASQVPPDYLSKVMQSLGRAGLVSAQRGKNGGFTLLKTPRELTILQIINAVDPIRRIETCPLGIPQHGVRLCALHRKLDNALEMVEKVFGSTTLLEMIDQPAWNKPLCGGLVSVHAKTN
ncbi:MAG: Rrf2 family transcriptional regulator [Acidobacteria bacterium]|nr:Rrf2 family transcriptional regulator [Acidobacteriota bacterium]